MTRFLAALLLLVLSACGDGAATQYAGTVMREDAPEAEGTMLLTLFSRDDSSFTGLMELGAPARGTGSAYAWFEGAELRVVTVGATTSDTIVWSSRRTDAEIGGRFEITGGERAGQVGTWRARLVRGAPASPATLRTPAPPPLPPVTALWPALVVLGSAVALARWVRRAPRGAPAADGTAWRAPPDALNGIGGWLLLFTIGQVIALLRWIVGAAEEWGNIAATFRVAAAASGMYTLGVLEATVHVVVLPVVVLGLWLIARRSPLAPRLWFAYLAASAAYLVIDIAGTELIRPQLEALVGAEVMDIAATRNELLRQLAFCLIWAMYWSRAERVRATFGATALDAAVIAPAGGEALAAAPARPARGARWWGRMALRVGAAVVALVVLGLAIVTWQARATPYEVPAGTDIRTVVAGDWTWDSDTTGCAGAHRIAFAEDGAVMTITSRDSTGAPHVTTYDAQVRSRSTIRGAIRGETRMTDDGEPVVWDLVLTGPDQYRWRQIDWPETSWSYTGSIRRCPAGSAVAAPDSTPVSASDSVAGAS